MVHTFRLLLLTLLLTLAGTSGGSALTLENRAGEKLVVAPEWSLVESPQAVPTHQENGGGYDELAADRLSFQSEDPIQFKAGDFNVSRYVCNSPLNHLDPSGHGIADYEEETDEAPVVIGGNMAQRVIPFAENVGGETYQPGPFTDVIDALQQQQGWIQQMINDGRTIINIGPDPAREGFSIFYDLEVTILEDTEYPFINALQP